MQAEFMVSASGAIKHIHQPGVQGLRPDATHDFYFKRWIEPYAQCAASRPSMVGYLAGAACE